jgi:hypothetical protein
MTEKEKREQAIRTDVETMRAYYNRLKEHYQVCVANGWTLEADINTLQYSMGELEKFFDNGAPAQNTHGVNFDKARSIP